MRRNGSRSSCNLARAPGGCLVLVFLLLLPLLLFARVLWGLW